MPLPDFAPSRALSVGVELELQLVEPTGLKLINASEDLLHLLDRSAFPGDAKPEITASMIEISTTVHEHYDTLLDQLQAMRDGLVKAGDQLNVAICGGGTHVFQHWAEQAISDKPRYLQLSQLYGYLAKQFTVFGQHVHIGCASANDALFLLHALGRYLPHFIALSASSPYIQGEDTQFDSARLNSVFAFPLSGRAPFILDWDNFAQGYFRKMEATGIVKDMKDFYWDIRPKPEYGTVELRVCDTPLSVERAAALAGYLQALCRHLLASPEAAPTEDEYLVYNFNRFQACRFGLDGILVDPKTNASGPLRDDILRTLALLVPHANELGSLPAIEGLHRIATQDGNDATLLRQHFAHGKRIEDVVELAVSRFRKSGDNP